MNAPTSTRRFGVTTVAGNIETSTMGDATPQFADVLVTATNARGETVEFVVPIAEQPKVGDVIDVPDYQIRDLH